MRTTAACVVVGVRARGWPRALEDIGASTSARCRAAHWQSMAMRRYLRSRKRVRLSASCCAKGRAINAAARRGQATGGTPAHIVLACNGSPTKVRYVEGGAAVTGPVSGADGCEQRGVSCQIDCLPIAKQKNHLAH